MYADSNKLTVFMFISTPDNSDKKVTLYTQYNVEDADDAHEIVKALKAKNEGLKIHAQITSIWNVC